MMKSHRFRSWDKMIKGMENLCEYPHVKILTNTVVTQLSYSLLPGTSAFLSGISNLVQMEFWNYWPMSRATIGIFSPTIRWQPHLLEAIRIAHENGKAVEVANFAMLLGEQSRLSMTNPHC